MKYDGLLLSKNCIPLATNYIEDLSNTTLNYLSQNSTNFVFHFWNHKSVFTIPLFCIFLAQTLYIFCKSCPKRCTFTDFPLLALKFSKFLMLFFGAKSQFFFKLRISVIRQLFCTLSFKSLYAFDKRSPSKYKFSDFWLLPWKLTKFLMSFSNHEPYFL